ncbi:hypothetical protein SLEP1_g27004 [Rubroshorea leprosula]|uniref:RRM domain-containing protein n=1 Tax=Rubroshorea leprosula TaxID=152421 RepID=A0AAV5JYA5_9ROSI|nr:hypothetical protein SLEP1_g27004 [Rubroshorea leprosula]
MIQEKRRDGYGKGILKQATSFFIANFPEEWRPEDMWKEFKRLGRVIHIYIANKRDKWGRRFGFVRYLDVKIHREMELNLSRIKVGKWRLQVNLAMYNEENGSVGMSRRENNAKAGSSKQVDPNVVGKSYANVVRNNKQVFERNEMMGKCWTPRKIHKEKKEMSEMGELQALDELKDKILIEGFFSINIVLMGGNLVLIYIEDDGEVTNFLKEGGEWMANVRPWGIKDVTQKRFTWIRCHGVPLNIWNEENFIKIGSVCGRVVLVDHNTLSKKRMDVGRILISRTSIENIVKILKIKVGNEFFQHSSSKWDGMDLEELEENIQETQAESFVLKERGMLDREADFSSAVDGKKMIVVVENTSQSEGEVEMVADLIVETKEGVAYNCPLMMLATMPKEPMNEVNFPMENGDEKAKNEEKIEADRASNNEPHISPFGLTHSEIRGKIEERLKKGKGARNRKVRSMTTKVISRCKRIHPDKANGVTFQIEQKEELSSRDNAISTGGIINCNRRFMMRSWEEEVKELWEVGKKLGLVRRGNEEEIIKRLAKFKEDSWGRSVVEGIEFKKVSDGDNAMLMAEFSIEEIKDAAWSCGGGKSPGLDSFHFNFIKRMWSLLEEDICGFIREFHHNGKLVRGYNAFFIVFIPKKSNLQAEALSGLMTKVEELGILKAIRGWVYKKGKGRQGDIVLGRGVDRKCELEGEVSKIPLAANKQAIIAEVGRSGEGEGKWGWEWCRTLFVWESNLL